MTTKVGYEWLLNNVDSLHRFSWDHVQSILLSNAQSAINAFHRGTICETVKSCLENPDLLLEYYRTTDPLVILLVVSGVFAYIHYIVSELTKNYSQVDKSWSILPALYAWHFALHDYLNRGSFHPRLLVASLLITIWGARLTYNFARKGGYEWKGQDYRYPYIAEKIGPLAMAILNLTVIAPFQDLLLALIVTPLYLTNLSGLSKDNIGLTNIDFAAITLHLSLLLFEVIADDQQFLFQTRKHAVLDYVDKSKLSGDYKRGFLSESGLWKYSRHPNFFAEMSMWWTIYLFSVATIRQAGLTEVVGSYLNWTVVGAFTLTLLFQGSTFLTEVV
ncbi:hypothetical protein J3Q64DRAFT_1646384 [Phycomyces blakesleeanus]|uniref:Steroid 5-alpha reductase C-terminal domain-containing protein n=1 Tax=Phycomyces blakesleeanus TaxID=4837 RepID=A0ABR3ANP2_PHYBL